MRKEEADKKAIEAESKRKRLEEAEKKRQAMMAAQKEKQQAAGKIYFINYLNLTLLFFDISLTFAS